MKHIKFLLLLFVIQVSAQQGGMWIPSLLEGMNENEMLQLGSKMTAKDIYDVNHSSLKDAIVHFDGGCTSEIISESALLLTNHHCGYGEIQSHSSVEHDYLKDGFWAAELSDELPNEGMVATLIVRIEDVTDQILKNLPEGLSDLDKEKEISKRMAKVEKKAKKEDWQGARIKPFYKGNQYMLFITETFKDIRLVGAPPTSIGKFGSDTDNWMWPRHTGDFALFRIYADQNNRPAEYSKDNKPYKPKHFLPISLDGVEEGDFTMVFGFPGRTNEYLPAVAIDQIVNLLNPAKIEIREVGLKIVDKYMRSDPKTKIQYASKYASIANYWKKWIGENQGLTRSKAIEKKQELERDFQEKVKDNAEYNKLLSDFDKLYKSIDQVSLARAYWSEVVYRNIELTRAAVSLASFEKKILKDPKVFESERTKIIARFERFYKNYNPEIDAEVFEKLMGIYIAKNPSQYQAQAVKVATVPELRNKIYSTSSLTSYKGFKSLLQGSQSEVIKKLNADEGYAFGKELSELYYGRISPKYNEINASIQAVQKIYMQALRETFPDHRFFPDANGTLRVTYGQVKGYQPRDAVNYQPVSYLSGVMEKYKEGDYEFDVPDKLIQLYRDKDYGNYGVDGKMPVNFLGTNHTTGGNSGSPALDAHGNLIGLNFDRVWEGTMSDYNYDPEICRNIMVDVRYILFVIDKIGEAERLIQELKLVHPKN